jgi:hypothetical protein
MIEKVKTYYGTTRNLGAVCKVRVVPAWRCTECGLIKFERDVMMFHKCEENTNEVPVNDFRSPVDGVRFEP